MFLHWVPFPTVDIMTNQAPTPAVQQNQDANVPFFNIQRVYLKGTSLELPGAPELFLEQSQLTSDLDVKLDATEKAPGIFEVVLHVTLTAKNPESGKPAFLLEVDQAGIFELRNIPAEHVQGLLYVRAPAILTNYVRVQITDTLSRATLPQFILPEFDWSQNLQAAAAAAAAEPTNRIMR